MVLAVLIPVLAILLSGILLMRFRKKWLAAFNIAVTNRITSHFAGRLLGFGIISHRGRRSGRVYRTPVNVFRTPNEFLVALTYGQESEWVKNVVAAGGCQLESRGARYHLTAPTIMHDPTRQRFPLPVRVILGFVGANDFMRLSADETKERRATVVTTDFHHQ